MAAVRVIRDERRGAAIHVPVQVSRDGLRGEVRLAGPKVYLPSDAADAGEADGQRATEDAAGHDAADLTGRADAIVVGGVEAEPGVDAERHTGLLHDLTQGEAFADRTRHGLLAPDGLTEARGRGGDDAMPVRRRADVDDVRVG